MADTIDFMEQTYEYIRVSGILYNGEFFGFYLPRDVNTLNKVWLYPNMSRLHELSTIFYMFGKREDSRHEEVISIKERDIQEGYNKQKLEGMIQRCEKGEVNPFYRDKSEMMSFINNYF